MRLPRQKTKIVCTVGPASEAPGVLERMIQAGMTVARLNFSHGDFDAHAKMITRLREAMRNAGRKIAIMADLSGPKIRIGALAEEPVVLQPGGEFLLTTGDVEGDRSGVSVAFPGLPGLVRAGDVIFLSDGSIQLETLEVKGESIRCRVIVGGPLRSRQGLNLPGTSLGRAAFTPRDRECLEFALAQGVDAVSQSFVEDAEDVSAVREAARALGHEPFVIAKIERALALQHIDAILAAADGIMIARGDLGIEVPIEQIPMVQKQLMHAANLAGKPVITATQMLESMTHNPRPTRAEVTDVANAILDGTDCVMLSGESAIGKYPVEAVAMLAKVAAFTEARRPRSALLDALGGPGKRTSPRDVIALSVAQAVEHVLPAIALVPTLTGASARTTTRFRLPVWVVAVSSREPTCQQLQFSYGVHAELSDSPGDWRAFARQWLREHELGGERVLLSRGPSERHPDATYRMEILDLDDEFRRPSQWG